MAPDKGKARKSAPKPKRSPSPSSPPARDPGPPYTVRWHPAAAAERDASWPPAEKAAMNNAVQKLQAAGPRLPHPHASAVQGQAGAGFRELRPRAGRSRWRPIYRQAAPDTFVIVAVAPEAQIDQRGFDAAVERAVSRFANLDLD